MVMVVVVLLRLFFLWIFITTTAAVMATGTIIAIPSDIDRFYRNFIF